MALTALTNMQMLTHAKFLGRGSAGAVFVHPSTLLNVEVARKVIQNEHHYMRELEMLTQCLTVASSSDSAFVCQLLRYGPLPKIGAYAIDLELAICDLEHVSLKLDPITRKYSGTHCPLLPTAEDVDRMYVQALRGLAHLHDKAGIIHNDIKPANMLIRADGRIQIADLGIASFMQAGPRFGTLSFSAPETFHGTFREHAKVNGKNDVFSLGASFCQITEAYMAYSLPHDVSVAFEEYRKREPNDAEGKKYYYTKMHKIATTYFITSYKVNMSIGRNVMHMSKAAKCLQVAMLERDSENRPSAKECLELFHSLAKLYNPSSSVARSPTIQITDGDIKSEKSAACDLSPLQNDIVDVGPADEAAVLEVELRNAFEHSYTTNFPLQAAVEKPAEKSAQKAAEEPHDAAPIVENEYSFITLTAVPFKKAHKVAILDNAYASLNTPQFADFNNFPPRNVVTAAAAFNNAYSIISSPAVIEEEAHSAHSNAACENVCGIVGAPQWLNFDYFCPRKSVVTEVVHQKVHSSRHSTHSTVSVEKSHSSHHSSRYSVHSGIAVGKAHSATTVRKAHSNRHVTHCALAVENEQSHHTPHSPTVVVERALVSDHLITDNANNRTDPFATGNLPDNFDDIIAPAIPQRDLLAAAMVGIETIDAVIGDNQPIDERTLLVQLANKAIGVKTIGALRADLNGDQAAMLDRLLARAGPFAPISDIARELLAVVHTKTLPCSAVRQHVFALLTGHGINWWKSATGKKLRNELNHE